MSLYFKLMWSDMKSFIADYRCQNNEEANAAIRAYSATVTPEKCNNWIDHLKNYVKKFVNIFIDLVFLPSVLKGYINGNSKKR